MMMTSVQTSVKAPCSCGFTIKFVKICGFRIFRWETCSKNLLVAFMSTVYLVKSLFCRNISVEYEFKLDKLKACMLIALNHAQATRNSHFKIFWVRIFARGTLLLFGCFSIHVKMCVLS